MNVEHHGPASIPSRNYPVGWNSSVACRGRNPGSGATEYPLYHCGGLQGFIGAWSDYYQYAVKQRGLGAYRCLESVIRLMQYCEENRRDTSEMTDEELTCSIREDIRGLIQQCPELAVTAARKIGWRVEPWHISHLLTRQGYSAG